VMRAERGGGDFVDASGQEWDVKSFQDVLSKPGTFDPHAAEDLIRQQIEQNGRHVILDTTALSQVNINGLAEIVARNGWSEQILWYPPR
jgi:hypothetical protein